MDIKATAKAWISGLIVVGLTWFGGIAENVTGVVLSPDVMEGIAGYAADAAVSLVFGYLGYLGVWRVPNAPQ